MPRLLLDETPIGPLLLEAGDAGLTAIRFDGAGPDGDARHPVLAEAAAQLHAWLAGRRAAFDLPLAPHGTPFQQDVWAALRAIPRGTTTTYGELAAQLGRPGASRAVGLANGRNPLPVVVPCHRVIGARGALTGFAGGLDRKRWLLAHEGALLM